MPPKAHPVRGFLYIGTATFFWGISATLGRAVFTGRLIPGGQALRPIDPMILAQSRTTFSFFVLLVILLLLRGRKGLQLPRRDLLHTILLGILGVAASNYFYYLAIQKTNVATAIILQYTAPAWVLLYLVARGQQKATVQRVTAVALAVLGSALAIGVGGGGFRSNALGLMAAVLASFSFAFYNLGGHDILARHDRWKILLYTLASATAFWIVVNPPWKIVAAQYEAGQWLFLVVFAMTSVLLPFSLYFAGLQHLDATSAIVGSCLEPVFSIVIAAVVLGEGVRPLQALGVIIVLAAIILVEMPDGASREEAALVEPME
ncbi:MAG: hypothetical protein DMG69_30925 [Acidobacteria bacterium]|nr:MAG: hypothetical protein DMG69_30925 [Acidobacteriota bacterium]